MASITREKNGRRTIQFVAADGIRKSIRLGKTSQRVAEAVKVKVEQLSAAIAVGHAPDNETSRWVAGLDQALADKLARVGLIPNRQQATLKAFVDQYIEGRSDVKGSTRTVYGHTRRCLIDFFGPDKALREITPGGADEWRISLTQQVLADNTVRRRCGIAKQLFKAAVRKQLIPSNPFTELKSSVLGNASRFYFISREEAQQVISACPDSQWRLLFALSRFGGLRCPSEHLALRLTDIDWERERVTVHSPKTEHHPGGESRVIPMFPELRPYLEEVFDQAEPGTEFVITRYRDTNSNLRTQLQRIIQRAGLKPWPKLFQNLRSTRPTELEREHPSHVVCAWIGNSRAVAAKHYLQITDEDFAKATSVDDTVGRSAGAVQNPVQQPAVSARNASQDEFDATPQAPVLQEFATECDCLQLQQVGDDGLEPPTSTV